MPPYFHRGSTVRTFNVPLFVPLPYFIRGRFVNFSTRNNKSLHTQGHLSFAGKKRPVLLPPLFKYFSVSMFISSLYAALFSVPIKIREHAYQYFFGCVWYGESMAVVLLQYVSGCGKYTIKVRRKYAESKAYVWLKFGKSTVKYNKSTVLYGNFFWRLL